MSHPANRKWPIRTPQQRPLRDTSHGIQPSQGKRCYSSSGALQRLDQLVAGQFRLSASIANKPRESMSSPAGWGMVRAGDGGQLPYLETLNPEQRGAVEHGISAHGHIGAPEEIELLTPKFVVWAGPLKSLRSVTVKSLQVRKPAPDMDCAAAPVTKRTPLRLSGLR